MNNLTIRRTANGYVVSETVDFGAPTSADTFAFESTESLIAWLGRHLEGKREDRLETLTESLMGYLDRCGITAAGVRETVAQQLALASKW